MKDYIYMGCGIHHGKVRIKLPLCEGFFERYAMRVAVRAETIAQARFIQFKAEDAEYDE